LVTQVDLRILFPKYPLPGPDNLDLPYLRNLFPKKCYMHVQARFASVSLMHLSFQLSARCQRWSLDNYNPEVDHFGSERSSEPNQTPRPKGSQMLHSPAGILNIPLINERKLPWRCNFPADTALCTVHIGLIKQQLILQCTLKPTLKKPSLLKKKNKTLLMFCSVLAPWTDSGSEEYLHRGGGPWQCQDSVR
jgi:hypothetical protein